MPEASRPLPRFPEPDTEPFWRATASHELCYQVCRACGAVVFYPRGHCTRCAGRELEWKVSKGEGTVYTFTVVRQNGHPFFSTQVPYAIALIDLDEGFRMMSNVVGLADPGREMRVGMRVRVSWEDHGEISLPLFRPA
jgi:uncharacterized OB-fold protein